MEEKKPRLFYWEDAESCWAPYPQDWQNMRIGQIIEDRDDGEEWTVRYKVAFMTDEEFENLPEV